MNARKDGKITFDEFCLWWYNGKDNPGMFLAYVQASKTFGKLHKKAEMIAKDIELKEGWENHSIVLKVGEGDIKTTFGFKFFFGKAQEEFATNLLKGNAPVYIGGKEPALVFQFLSKNGEQAKAKFKEIITNGLDIAKAMIPIPEALTVLNSLQVDFLEEGGQVTMVIKSTDVLINSIFAQVFSSIEFFTKEMSAELEMGVKSGISPKVILNENGKQMKASEFLAQYSSTGFEWKVKLGESVRQTFQNFLIDFVKSDLALLPAEENARKQKLNVIKQNINGLAFAQLLSSVNINVDWKLLSGVESLGIKQGTSIDGCLQIVKMLVSLHVKGLIESLPLVNELIEFGKEFMQANATLSMMAKGVGLAFEMKTEGIKELVEFLLQP